MKPFVFNKDSWHYWLATELTSFSKYKTESNICEYTRAVLKGAFWATVGLAVALGLIYWVVITLVWWVVVFQHGFFDEPAPIVLSAIVGIFAFSAGVSEGVPRLWKKARRKLYDSRQAKREKVKTDNFITEAYRSWKEKTCVRVTLVEDTSDE